MDFCHARGWDYSVSVTHDGFRRPVLESIEDLPETAWTDIGLGEEALLTWHHPQGWREHPYGFFAAPMRAHRGFYNRPIRSFWSPGTTCRWRNWFADTGKSRGRRTPS